MKLLHKVVKSSLISKRPEPVLIDNTIVIPVKPVVPEVTEEISEEQKALIEKERQEKEKQKEIDNRVKTEVERIRNTIDAENASYQESTRKMRDDIIREAEEKSQKMIDDSKAEIAKAFDEAKEKAHREGFEDGRQEALSQCSSYVKTAAQFLGEINAKKEAYFIQNQDELFSVCMEMAEKITLQELKTDKKVLFNILEQAAKRYRNSDYLKISFAKGDVTQEVVADIEFIRTLVGNIPDIDVEILPEASEGTVILDDNSEITDASVPTQLGLLQEIMKNSQNHQ